MNSFGNKFTILLCFLMFAHILSNIATFPDLSIYLSENNVLVTETNNGKNEKNKTQVVMNQIYPLLSAIKVADEMTQVADGNAFEYQGQSGPGETLKAVNCFLHI